MDFIRRLFSFVGLSRAPVIECKALAIIPVKCKELAVIPVFSRALTVIPIYPKSLMAYIEIQNHYKRFSDSFRQYCLYHDRLELFQYYARVIGICIGCICLIGLLVILVMLVKTKITRTRPSLNWVRGMPTNVSCFVFGYAIRSFRNFEYSAKLELLYYYIAPVICLIGLILLVKTIGISNFARCINFNGSQMIKYCDDHCTEVVDVQPIKFYEDPVPSETVIGPEMDTFVLSDIAAVQSATAIEEVEQYGDNDDKDNSNSANEISTEDVYALVESATALFVPSILTAIEEMEQDGEPSDDNTEASNEVTTNDPVQSATIEEVEQDNSAEVSTNGYTSVQSAAIDSTPTTVEEVEKDNDNDGFTVVERKRKNRRTNSTNAEVSPKRENSTTKENYTIIGSSTKWSNQRAKQPAKNQSGSNSSSNSAGSIRLIYSGSPAVTHVYIPGVGLKPRVK